MPSFAAVREDRTDYYLIVEPRPEGETIGVFADRPISEAVRDCFGRSYDFVGAAPRRQNGLFDIDALKPGEFIVPPGLVYRMIMMRQNSAASTVDHESASRLFRIKPWTVNAGVRVIAILSCVLVVQILASVL